MEYKEGTDKNELHEGSPGIELPDRSLSNQVFHQLPYRNPGMP